MAPGQLLKAGGWMLLGIFALSAVAVAGREVSSTLDTFELMLYRSPINAQIQTACADYRAQGALGHCGFNLLALFSVQ